MIRCRICDCICDPGDLRNGMCDDCRYEEQKEKERKQEMIRLANANFKQLRLEDILDESNN